MPAAMAASRPNPQPTPNERNPGDWLCELHTNLPQIGLLCSTLHAHHLAHSTVLLLISACCCYHMQGTAACGKEGCEACSPPVDSNQDLQGEHVRAQCALIVITHYSPWFEADDAWLRLAWRLRGRTHIWLRVGTAGSNPCAFLNNCAAIIYRADWVLLQHRPGKLSAR